MFRKLLIANRGEIACRIIRTCRDLGIRTVAVHSDADRDALHVAMADEALRIGPAEPRASYLDVAAILRAAVAAGAEAIHPGYGFLSERAEFAEACDRAGIVFVGPPAAAIRAMGDKAAAKALMEASGVPVVPGWRGEATDDAVLVAEAQRIGWPVLIKAVAGGGGKGMKLASDAAAFPSAVASARREAQAAFGDGRLLLERYVEAGRHVEVQVFADRHGGCVHLFDRDCSIQRRHQKIVEEAPAPGLSDGLRQRMGEAAVAAARVVDYVGAGTVEFILGHDDSFYFMEMNTRLQVEHPVTELITGLDLVEWQLRVAAGERLPWCTTPPVARGHSIEARLYAEDPARGFLPQTGRLAHLRFPAQLAGLRVDTGVSPGDSIGIHYDPMVAKIVAHGPDRETARRRLQDALRSTEVAGVVTNLEFLRAVVAHPAFAAADVDTGFVERHAAELLALDGPIAARSAVLATLGLLEERDAAARAATLRSTMPGDPWGRTDSWQPNLDAVEIIVWRHGEATIEVRVHRGRDGLRIGVERGDPVKALVERDGDARLVAGIGDARMPFTWVRDGHRIHVFAIEGDAVLDLVDLGDGGADETAADDRVVAPMPGRVTAVHVAQGDTVVAGQALLVLEAMKMEHALRATLAGRVEAVRCTVGEQVVEGVVLVELAPQ